MGDISRNAFLAYEDAVYEDDRRRALTLEGPSDGGLFRAFLGSGRGSNHATAKSVYESLLSDVREDSGDRGVWTRQGKTAHRKGITDRCLRDALVWLVANGFVWEWRCPRILDGVKTTSYHIVDVIGENRALAVWATERQSYLEEGLRPKNTIPGNDEFTDQAAEQVESEILAAAARFDAAHPGHYATRARVLAILEGREPVVGRTKSEAYGAANARKAARAATGVPATVAVVEPVESARTAPVAPVVPVAVVAPVVLAPVVLDAIADTDGELVAEDVVSARVKAAGPAAPARMLLTHRAEVVRVAATVGCDRDAAALRLVVARAAWVVGVVEQTGAEPTDREIEAAMPEIVAMAVSFGAAEAEAV